jgi:hypothetical protein
MAWGGDGWDQVTCDCADNVDDLVVRHTPPQETSTPMKRLIIGALALTTLGLAACGGDTATDSPTTTIGYSDEAGMDENGRYPNEQPQQQQPQQQQPYLVSTQQIVGTCDTFCQHGYGTPSCRIVGYYSDGSSRTVGSC